MKTNEVDNILTEGPVLLRVENNIAHLTLNRPKAANGLNVDLLKVMYEAVMTCHGDDRVRAVILNGNGANFCAGGDVKEFLAKGDDLPHYLREATSYLQIVVAALMRLNAPVIASVHGFAAGGGGFGFVCAADLVVATESSKYLAGATRVGMAPDAGVSVTLQNLVGFKKAMEILLTNPTLSSKEALDLGIINKVVEDDGLEKATLEMATLIANNAPLSMSETKRLLWNGMGSPVATCLADESRTVSALSGTADSLEGLAAVIERRDAKFIGR